MQNLFQRRLLILLILCSLFWPETVRARQDAPPPPPHLGYGVHIAPNTNLDRNLVNALGVDWVKIYATEQAKDYPGKRILFRWDLSWPTDWAQFKINVANRARELISLNIDAIEVGNEPNLVNEWTRGPNAWEYVQMLRVAYTAIKAGNPNIIVVSAGLAPTLTTPDRKAISDLDYAQEMLDNGAAQWFDAFGYHPYGYNLPPEADPTQHELVFRRTERIRAVLEKHGVYKQIWLTEFGWLRDPAEDGVNCKDSDPDFAGFAWLRVTGEQQASYLVRAFQYADQNWPWAGPTFVWNLNWHQQTWLNMCNHQRWFSLLRLNGEPTIAYRKLQAMERHPSDYLPHLELHTESLAVDVSLACLRRMPLGQFTIANTGYPLPVPITISPANGPQPPFVEVDKKQARAGDTIKVFVDPTGLQEAGQYPVYINVKATVNKRPFTQNIEGFVVASQAGQGCN
ncbi:MAG: hypothetical protein ABI947_23640 [Chloroflexota bacterium]